METVFVSKTSCCGCSACAEVCPVSAIEMKEDAEGFFYPQIDKTRCIDCGKCQKICSFCKPKPVSNQSYLELKSRDNTARARSRSGGAFFEIARTVINENGVVYGVGTSKGKIVEYKRAESLLECESMQGSKYVECTAKGILKSVEADLLSNRKVLFSGTACQVAGLKAYLEQNKQVNINNLLTIDIICHGVPSKKIYYSYIDFLEKKYGGEITSFNFRDKSYGWRNHVETFVINGKKRTKDTYSGMFYSNYFLRPSCGFCPFASFDRPADITIGDFWRMVDAHSRLDDNKGVSVVIINSDKGRAYIDNAIERMDSYELKKEVCYQPNLEHPSIIPDDREKAWDYYTSVDFLSFLKKYGRYDFLHKLKWYLKDYPNIKKDLISREEI